MKKQKKKEEGTFNTQLAEQIEKFKKHRFGLDHERKSDPTISPALNVHAEQPIECPGYVTSIRDDTEACLNCGRPRHE